jgi:hypothetical protein
MLERSLFDGLVKLTGRPLCAGATSLELGWATGWKAHRQSTLPAKIMNLAGHLAGMIEGSSA